jgi:methylated-DNA-[protein]-cysteine S-methyltransferase
MRLPSDLTPFQRKVFEAVLRIPRGDVRTYKEIAAEIGKPNAWRAVGSALKRNPFPVRIPCHRVVRSDGSLGGYFGKAGVGEKRRLLLSEGVRIPMKAARLQRSRTRSQQSFVSND